MSLPNPQNVLITGASSGIGLELARCFAAEGCRLLLVARNRSVLESLAAEIRLHHGIQADVYPADLTRPEAPRQLFDQLRAAGTRVDVLVNNAAFGAQGQFSELACERQVEMVEVNVTALTHLTRLFLPAMLEQRSGGILNVASTAGFQPGPRMAVYYATKAYVISFTEAIAEELAGTGVTVTALCPGSTNTNFAQAANSHFSSRFKKSAMSAEEVARFGHRAFRQGRVVAIPGARNKFLAFAVRFAPRPVVRKITKALNAVSYSD